MSAHSAEHRRFRLAECPTALTEQHSSDSYAVASMLPCLGAASRGCPGPRVHRPVNAATTPYRLWLSCWIKRRMGATGRSVSSSSSETVVRSRSDARLSRRTCGPRSWLNLMPCSRAFLSGMGNQVGVQPRWAQRITAVTRSSSYSLSHARRSMLHGDTVLSGSFRRTISSCSVTSRHCTSRMPCVGSSVRTSHDPVTVHSWCCNDDCETRRRPVWRQPVL